ncbi:MAG: hypothetical protein BGO67_10335 [Alphaproteobacteria bacterium 41-28]|nr:MAG: hypothetical protein BGO67_10335 [Alphaproteobacteria bacterium 41-28]
MGDSLKKINNLCSKFIFIFIKFILKKHLSNFNGFSFQLSATLNQKFLCQLVSRLDGYLLPRYYSWVSFLDSSLRRMLIKFTACSIKNLQRKFNEMKSTKDFRKKSPNKFSNFSLYKDNFLLIRKPTYLFRKMIGYVAIVSLIWSNCVWAVAPLRIVEEDFDVCPIRTYIGQKIGVVEPGILTEQGLVHNIFDDFQVPSGSGVIFKGDSETPAIFNRIYSKNPVRLSGVIQSNASSPMVFSNPGGLNLENPEFQHIPSLTLAAGGMSNTDQGYSYGINHGLISLYKTVFEEGNDVKSLAVAGRTVQLSQSILAPSESIDVTAGQHIGGLGDEEDLKHPIAYIADDAPSFSYDHSILIDPTTILRSKKLSFRSFDKGTPIYAMGLLESTDQDIHIQAQGDVYLHHLIAARNLHIETTGRVFLGDQAWVGGTVNIKAKDIHVSKGLSSVGKAFLQASHVLNIEGSVTSEEKVVLKGTKGLNIGGPVASRGKLKAKSQGDIKQQGFLYSGDILKVKGKAFTKRGQILSEGPLKVSTENNIENQEGNIASLSTSLFSSQKGKIINRGEITSEEAMEFASSEAHNYGLLGTSDILQTHKGFVNERQGTLKAKSLSNPNALLSKNSGLIELTDDLHLKAQAAVLKGKEKTKTPVTVLKGKIRVQGQLEASGQDLAIEGDIVAQGGVHFNLNSLDISKKGKLSAFGQGLEGTIGTLTHEGKMDLSRVNTTINQTKIQEKGVVRTKGHFAIGGMHYENKGTVFTGGVHQVTLEGSYKDTGTIYSPTLFLLKARNVEYFPGHVSYLRDGVISASSNLTAGEKVQFQIESDRDKCFLQLSSQGNLTYKGTIKQTSARFPLLDYFKMFGEESPILYQDFADKIYGASLEPWKSMKPSASGVILTAGGDINCQKATIDPESGSVSLIAGGQFNTDGAKIKAGYFKGNDALAKGKTVYLKDTSLKSLFGTASVIAEETLHLKNAHILGGQYAEAKGKSVKMEGSSVKSSHGAALVQAQKKAQFDRSVAQGKTSATLESRKVKANDSQIVSEGTSTLTTAKSATIKGMTLTGERTVLDVGETLDMSMTSLLGQYNKISATHIEADSLKTKGVTAAEAKESFTLKSLNSEGTFVGRAKDMTLSKKVEGGILDFEADHLRNKGDTHAEDHLRMKGKTFEQLGTTKSDKSSHLEGTEKYVDSENSRNEAGEVLALIAEKTNGFKGKQKADVAVLKLQDMNLINLLNQTEARVTQAHLKEADIKLDADLGLKTNLHLWANSFDNRANLTGNEFIVHTKTTILNRGSMNFHGKAFLKAQQGITNTGDIAAEGLGFETDGVFTHKGKADAKGGTLSAKAKRIDADAEVHTYQEVNSPNPHTTVSTRKARFVIPSFSGKNVRLESDSSLNARGAQITAEQDVDLIAKEDIHLDAIAYAEGDQEVTFDLGAFGKLTAKTDPRNKYLQGAMKAGGNIRAKTDGKLHGQGLKADAGGSIVLQADKGVDLSSLAAVSVVERWNYNTGLFGQNNHRGFREDAEFYRSELTSRGGGIFVIAKQGGITARGTAFQAQDEIRLDARDKVELGALKATIRYASHDEDQFLCFGSSDDKEGSTERFRQMQAISNKKIGIFSRQGTIEGEVPFMRAPEIELDGEKGILFKPLEIHSQEDTHHYENNLNLNPNSIEFEHKEKHTKTKTMQQVAGTLQTDQLSVRTGIGAKASMTANISGHKEGGTTDIIADTDELAFTGIKSTYDHTMDAWSVKVSVDVNMMPGGGFDVSHDELRKTTYGATVQKFGTFHNKRKGATLRVEGGAQTSINETIGEDMKAVVDHSAQDREAQEGYSFGVSASSTGGSAHFSAKGGEKVSSDQITGLHIGKSTNKVTRQDIEHEIKDTRWGVGVGVSVDKNGKFSASAQVQVGNTKIGGDVPLDGEALRKKFDPSEAINSFKEGNVLEKAQKATNALSSTNNTLNDLGMDTGDVGKGIKTAQKATQVASQAYQSYQQIQSTSQSNSFSQAAEKGFDTLAQINKTAQTAGVNTGPVGDAIKTTQSVKRTAKNAVAFGENVADKVKEAAEREAKKSVSQVNPASFVQKVQEKELSSPAIHEEMKESVTDESNVDKKKQPAKKASKKPTTSKKKQAQRDPASTKVKDTEGKEILPEITSDNPFVSKVIAQRKAHCLREGKSWSKEKEAQARKEAETEIKGIDPVTWHEDLATGGVGLARSFATKGLKEAGKYGAKKIAEAVKDELQEQAVAQVAEAIGIASEQAQTFSQLAGMVGHGGKSAMAGKSRSSHGQHRAQSRLKKENPAVSCRSYEHARNEALKEVGQIDAKSKRPHIGNLGVGQDKVVGFDTKVNGVPKTYRVDYDKHKGPHINVQVGKGPGSNTPFTFPGTEEDVAKIVNQIDHLNAHKKGH